jgi:hypothetical protein
MSRLVDCVNCNFYDETDSQALFHDQNFERITIVTMLVVV